MAGVELLQYILAFTLGIIGLTFFMTWLNARANSSLVPMIIAHFSLNFSSGLVGPGGLGLAEATPLMALFGGLMVLTDLLLWTLARRPAAARARVAAALNVQAANTFTPDLTLLDAVMSSLEIK